MFSVRRKCNSETIKEARTKSCNFFRNRSVKTQKKKRNQPHTRLKKQTAMECVLTRSWRHEVWEVTALIVQRSLTLHSKINRRYLKMM